MKTTFRPIKTLGIFSLAAFCGLIILSLNSGGAQAGKGKPHTRFDYLVRTDFFAGFSGDSARLAKGMRLCEDTLRKRPNFPEAMVWHGSGTLYYSGVAYREGNMEKGLALWNLGLAEMDSAVQLAPDNLGVIIARGATLVITSQYLPAPYNLGILKTGLGDYEHALELQRPRLSTMSAHARGELLGGLADGYHRLGNEAKSKEFFQQIIELCKGSDYAKIATDRLAGGAKYEAPTCQGCHME